MQIASPERAKLFELTSPDAGGYHAKCITWKKYPAIYVF